MTALMPITINGQSTINGQPLLAQAETTSGPILGQYTADMQVFNDIFNLSLTSSNAQSILNGVDPNSPTGLTYAAQMQASIADLNNIAANGVPNPALNGFNEPQRMTIQMAGAMSQLYQTLTAVGIPTDGSTITSAQLANWYNFAYSSSTVQSTLASATLAVGPANATLQSLTELVYVQEGNNIISTNLNNLQSALSTTNNVLMTLTDVQTLANQITATNKESFQSFVNVALGATNGVNWMDTSYAATQKFLQNGNGKWLLAVNPGEYSFYRNNGYNVRSFNGANGTVKHFIDLSGHGIGLQPASNRFTLQAFGADPSVFGVLIPSLASAFFGGILPPQVAAGLQNSINPYVLQFLNYRTQIANEIQQLSAVTGQLSNPQTLYGTLKAVYSNMNTAITVNHGYMPSALKMWILDGQTTSGNTALGPSGSVQTNINNAITAGQNLNNSQTEQTRQYLFVFEEFYQSASSILSTITQAITTMAQNAGR